MKKLQTKLLSAITVVFAIPSIGLAMPSVSGNTLSWPDDGWYQVQRADTFETVCEGMVSVTSSASGGPCIIDSNNHIVINHSSGERFVDIKASDASTPVVNGVMVDGKTVSWPNDGWYQVQRADTFETVCEGMVSVTASKSGGPCIINSNNHIVINHSNGERFTDIKADDASSPVVSSLMVDGNNISWPNDGWYQVQNADTFATVCEGGTECQVSAGRYIVINHTSGERTPLMVNGVQQPSLTQISFAIFVPVYVSNSLQVKLTWGDEELSAAWEVDELWRVSGNFARNTENLLTATFYDRNGEIVLGTFAANYNTGTNTEDFFRIDADDFDTTSWDSDGDGVSNLDESIAGTDPLTVGDPLTENKIRVNFGINVPAYVSDSLQVILAWGDREIAASWVGDESWSAFDDLPTNTEEPLSVTFYDDNGGIVLGNYETTYQTGTNASEYFQIESRKINTTRWDDDNDGVNNLDELIAETDPLVNEDSLLEIRDSADFFFGSAAIRYESLISDERPHVSTTINLDLDGNGTQYYSDRSNYYDQKSSSASRTNTGNSILWEGTTWGYDGDYGRRRTFTNEVTLVDETTRTYIEETSDVYSGTYTDTTTTTSNLTGELVEATSFCKPVSGTASRATMTTRGSPDSTTSISKEIDDAYWRVRIVIGDNEPTEYFARELHVRANDVPEVKYFKCDFVDF